VSKLRGQVALVSGAARGIGRAYALRLAALGADVALLDIDLRSFDAFETERAALTAPSVVEEVRACGVRSVGLEADVADPDAVSRAVKVATRELGDVSILVANAGGGQGAWGSHASDMDLGDMRKIVERNFYGTVHQVQAVVPAMKRRGNGRIVTVASQSALAPAAGGVYAHYAAAKAAVVTYTRYLSQELAPHGINVNCVAPGYIATGRLLAMAGPRLDSILANIPMGRIGTPEDCAGVIEFLTTDLSDYVTGTVVDVAGGFTGSGNLTGAQPVAH
jgi:3-oxoacyl-[acyl-carrier protein] reductase